MLQLIVFGLEGREEHLDVDNHHGQDSYANRIKGSLGS